MKSFEKHVLHIKRALTIILYHITSDVLRAGWCLLCCLFSLLSPGLHLPSHGILGIEQVYNGNFTHKVDFPQLCCLLIKKYLYKNDSLDVPLPKINEFLICPVFF